MLEAASISSPLISIGWLTVALFSPSFNTSNCGKHLIEAGIFDGMFNGM